MAKSTFLGAAIALVLIAGCSESGRQASDERDGPRADQQVAGKPGPGMRGSDGAIEFRSCEGEPIRVERVAGDQAVGEWTERASEFDRTGLWPVILGDQTSAEGAAYTLELACEEGFSERKALRRVERVDIDVFLGRRGRSVGIRDKDLKASPPLPKYEFEKDVFLVPLDFEGEPLEEILIALVAVEEPWQAPVALAFGNYNENPPPDIHGALIKRWQQDYGAEVVAVTEDEIELRAKRPPQSEKDALALARDYFRYAPDSVFQGVGDLEMLAAGLLEAEAWYFWWD